MIRPDEKPRLYVRLNFVPDYKWLCVSHRETGAGATAREAYEIHQYDLKRSMDLYKKVFK